eukprot:6910945-Pyramimonas_sp.AAC.1
MHTGSELKSDNVHSAPLAGVYDCSSREGVGNSMLLKPTAAFWNISSLPLPSQRGLPPVRGLGFLEHRVLRRGNRLRADGDALLHRRLGGAG